MDAGGHRQIEPRQRLIEGPARGLMHQPMQPLRVAGRLAVIACLLAPGVDMRMSIGACDFRVRDRVDFAHGRDDRACKQAKRHRYQKTGVEEETNSVGGPAHAARLQDAWDTGQGYAAA